MTFNNCIECEGEIRCLTEDLLLGLTEEGLEIYLKCDEGYLKFNQIEREQLNSERIHLLTA